MIVSSQWDLSVRGMGPTNGYWRHSGGQRIICLPILSVRPSKIFNMSNNVGLPLNTLFVGRSCRQNSSVSICRSMTSW